MNEIQGALFESSDLNEKGYKGSVATELAGISYRQLDHWATKGYVSPSIQNATGSGSVRLYSFKDILLLRVVKKLRDIGIEMDSIFSVITQLRSQNMDTLSDLLLICDGRKVYQCNNEKEIFSLMTTRGSIFLISVAQIHSEIMNGINRLEAKDNQENIENVDELAVMRSRKVNG